MRTLTADEATEASLDPERTWLEVACPAGHSNFVEDHEGGSRAHCNTCGEAFDYGAPLQDAAAAADAAGITKS